MDYNYLYLLFFAAFSLAIPALFLLASRLLRKNYSSNEVKNAPYESGEETIGKNLAVDNEYFPFIMLFLPFEIIAVLMLLFSSYIYSEKFAAGMELFGLVALAALFAVSGYALIKRKVENR